MDVKTEGKTEGKTGTGTGAKFKILGQILAGSSLKLKLDSVSSYLSTYRWA